MDAVEEVGVVRDLHAVLPVLEQRFVGHDVYCETGTQVRVALTSYLCEATCRTMPRRGTALELIFESGTKVLLDGTFEYANEVPQLDSRPAGFEIEMETASVLLTEIPLPEDPYSG